eukprot:TRINITY_DN60151_c0_g1_i1.p2 TRINITY_DN60151_c0_g1~~TRINITY_DN60151_c0_g1_i1.p2  ORF type:complete len:132 (+),score=20.91 TRINITY_DN60151_c0_g1_i1:22-396(+)
MENLDLREFMLWFFRGFSDKLSAFAKENCGDFNEDENAEQKPECMIIYNKYKELAEAELEGYLKEKGVKLDDFYEFCKKQSASSDRGWTTESEDPPVFDCIVAATDFQQFYPMMIAAKKDQLKL